MFVDSFSFFSPLVYEHHFTTPSCHAETEHKKKRKAAIRFKIYVRKNNEVSWIALQSRWLKLG